MKTIELDFEFMEALNTLDLAKVQATRKYREMCAVVPGRETEVNKCIECMIDHSLAKRDRDPEAWAGIVKTTATFAAKERENRREIQ